jgi:hypothetical protein
MKEINAEDQSFHVTDFHELKLIAKVASLKHGVCMF